MSDVVLKDLSGPVVLLGAGKMGGAMLEGWLKLGLPPHLAVVIDPHLPDSVALALKARGVAVNPPAHVVAAPAVLLLAVKPQVAPDAVPQVAPLARPGTLVVSIMAGRTLAFLADHFPDGTPLVRAIPNTPAAIGRGVSVAVPSATVSTADRALASALLGAIGIVEWVDDEALMDAATAVSGSGPAYVFLLAEVLAEAGRAAGLPADLSARIARATVSGSGALLDASDLPAATLRQNVTSPGGTTAAALAVLMHEARGFGPLMEAAVAAATRRGKELAG
ncbi:pyrroline-5-carboxylate reductase [Xanthobacter agilis]|jgi:pyrroline-5-carboxylate reductase|uniref:Pyrroline-5-carboxylate reductase n=1 Tax=Xanthobacter agilis TaxID=47492 RepID=A0ABU0LCR0_XANAG|nr:pyrroline-5-carboxylate reductase [Xanthobacter agilis]MDQ0504914.1 pyrroline-5-carboxylate reductase [Xanthobacter agilis]